MMSLPGGYHFVPRLTIAPALPGCGCQLQAAPALRLGSNAWQGYEMDQIPLSEAFAKVELDAFVICPPAQLKNKQNKGKDKIFSSTQIMGGDRTAAMVSNPFIADVGGR